MTGRRHPFGTIARIAAVIGTVVVLSTVAGHGDEPADALAPSSEICAGNPAFCGAILRIDSAAGSIPSVAAGAHYGPVWEIPAADNNTTGVGWCVDDTHTGYPVGPITERALPSAWTSTDIRRAATIITLFGGDDVLPYQPLRVDRSGELAGVDTAGISATRHRQIAVWFALRSLLPDSAGTPRIDLDSATTSSDTGGRHPSTIGNSAVRLARQLVRVADTMTATSQPTLSVTAPNDRIPTSIGTAAEVIVHVADGDGTPLANTPVWPTTTSNTVVRPDRRASTAVTNAEAAGWPTLDSSRQLQGASVTDASGNATFSIEVERPGKWSVQFDAALAPSKVHLYGDGISAQNNVSILADEVTRASGSVEGEVAEQFIRVVKTTTDPTFGVAGGLIAVVDADGNEVARGTTDADGVIDFPAIDASHPSPLAIREMTAPVGLALRATDIEVSPEGGLSRDPAAPTIVEIENHPVAHELVVQKAVVGSTGFGPSLDRFGFTVIRDVDDAEFGTVVTDESGRTPPVALPAGQYSILEVERPERWPGDQSLPDPIAVTVPVDASSPIVVNVENVLPPPSITTAAADRADGDKYLSSAGGTVVDEATVCGAVDGTTYTIEGQLHFVKSDGSVESTDIRTTAEFVAAPDESGCESIELAFAVPADSDWLERRGHFVVTEELFVEAERVAAHDDVESIEQSVFVAKVRSQAVDLADGDGWIDRDGGTILETLTVSDLDPSRPEVELRADSVLMVFSADGELHPSGASATTTFTVGDIDAQASPTVEIPYSSGNLSDDRGTAVVFTTITDVATGLVVAEHHDPFDAAQQVRWRPVTVVPPPPEHPQQDTPPPAPPRDLPRTGGDSTGTIMRWGSALALVGSLLFVASGTRRRHPPH